MRMSVNSYEKMNGLSAKCFEANAIIDNLVYNLDYDYYAKLAKVIHLSIAHIMPVLADQVTDEILTLGGRPTREAIPSYNQKYEDVAEIIQILKNTFYDIRNFCQDMIESAEINGDDEVRIFGEDFLVKMSPYIKQSEEWELVLQKIGAFELNIHISDFTNHIPTVD